MDRRHQGVPRPQALLSDVQGLPEERFGFGEPLVVPIEESKIPEAPSHLWMPRRWSLREGFGTVEGEERDA